MNLEYNHRTTDITVGTQETVVGRRKSLRAISRRDAVVDGRRCVASESLSLTAAPVSGDFGSTGNGKIIPVAFGPRASAFRAVSRDNYLAES